jgi:hypothetical protein
MTTSVIVTRKGGNKAVDVVIEAWFPEHPAVESGDAATPAQWKDVSRQTLHNPEDSSLEIYVYDTQRIRIEETGDFVDAEPKVD